MHAAGFSDCSTREVQRITVDIPADEALRTGRLKKSSTSQLALLSDEEYRRGLDRIRESAANPAMKSARRRLRADLRLFATVGHVPINRPE